MIIDGFAGPGGWDEGLRMLSRDDVIGIEWDKAACQTARAAGHRRLHLDIAKPDLIDRIRHLVTASIEGVIMSAPCQAWSMAGKRKGELDRANCHTLADRMADGDDSTDWTIWEDDRSPLVCQPVRWVRELRPEWVALEEVPAVASLWEHFARIFTMWGYRVWTGDLCAADYGVPQTRTRRILMAHRSRPVAPPPPTHSEAAHGDDLFGGETLPWVSMAEALGWGFDEPSCTVSGGGTAAGGAEPFANANYRKRLARLVGNQRTSPGKYYERDVSRPEPTLTSNVKSWTVQPGERPPVYVNGNQPNAGRRSIDEPAPTVLFGHRSNDVRWVHEWPLTTIAGYRTSTSRQNAEGSVRVTVQEAGILQSFPANYPWQGSRTAQFRQVGDAVPPLLAAHILQSLGAGTITRSLA